MEVGLQTQLTVDTRCSCPQLPWASTCCSNSGALGISPGTYRSLTAIEWQLRPLGWDNLGRRFLISPAGRPKFHHHGILLPGTIHPSRKDGLSKSRWPTSNSPIRKPDDASTDEICSGCARVSGRGACRISHWNLPSLDSQGQMIGLGEHDHTTPCRATSFSQHSILRRSIKIMCRN